MPADFCETITESEDFNVAWATESNVDEAGLIKNVPLCGNRSKNGYDIPPAAFRNEAHVKSLYEGKPVCIDHSEQSPKSRGVRDLAGHVVNARYVGGKPWGDIRTEGCPAGQMLVGLAKGKLPHVGLSHTARYRFNKSRTAVESVDEVFTVDAVLFPATNRNFQERDRSDGESYMPADTVELLSVQLKEQRESYDARIADLTKQVTALESAKTSLESSLKTVTSERDAASAKVVSFETAKALADRQASVVESCKKAGIDTENEKVCPKSWLGYVCSIESATEQAKAISEHADLVKSFSGGKSSPTSQERQSVKESDWSAESALKNIRFVG